MCVQTKLQFQPADRSLDAPRSAKQPITIPLPQIATCFLTDVVFFICFSIVRSNALLTASAAPAINPHPSCPAALSARSACKLHKIILIVTKLHNLLEIAISAKQNRWRGVFCFRQKHLKSPTIVKFVI